MLKNIFILLLGAIMAGYAGRSDRSDLSEINSTPTIDSAYVSAGNTANGQEEISIIEKSNNTSRAYDLITRTYPEEALLKFYDKDRFNYTPMTALNAVCEIECIRKINDNKYYTIHISDSGGILYSMFSKDNNGVFKVSGSSTDDVVNTWYVKKIITKSEFEKLKINSSTLKDVKNIDMYGFYSVDLAPYLGSVMEYGGSSHLTADGYKISVIYYLALDGECIVTDVTIEKADENSLYGSLLPMDRPENLLKQIQENAGENK